jgi:hypothetical protein
LGTPKGIKDGTADAALVDENLIEKLRDREKNKTKKPGGSHGWELLEHIEDYMFE